MTERRERKIDRKKRKIDRQKRKTSTTVKKQVRNAVDKIVSDGAKTPPRRFLSRTFFCIRCRGVATILHKWCSSLLRWCCWYCTARWSSLPLPLYLLCRSDEKVLEEIYTKISFCPIFLRNACKRCGNHIARCSSLYLLLQLLQLLLFKMKRFWGRNLYIKKKAFMWKMMWKLHCCCCCCCIVAQMKRC